jgi:hypothetical protein
MLLLMRSIVLSLDASSVASAPRARHAATREALEGRLDDLKRRARERLADMRRAAHERADAIQRLIDEHLPEEESDENFDDLTEEAEEIMSEAEDLARQIEDELSSEAPSVDEFEWPEPDEGFEDPLFDSTRDYVEQIDRYKGHQDKPTEKKVRTFIPRTCECVVCGNQFEALRPGRLFCSRGCSSGVSFAGWRICPLAKPMWVSEGDDHASHIQKPPQ